MTTAAERMARLRAHRIALGLCPKCGMVPPRDGYESCDDCAARFTTYESNRRGKLIANGLCYRCKAPTTTFQLCLACRRKQRSWRTPSMQLR